MVSAWSAANGISLGQVKVDDKSNEITAVPLLIRALDLDDCIVTIDAMGTQTAIAEKIRSKRADYVLALKGNQTSLHEDVCLYFEDAQVLQEICDKGNYRRTAEKAHGQIENL